MRNWRITWVCIAIYGFAWLVFSAKAQQPEWSSATLTLIGTYGGNGTWNQKITLDLHRQGNQLVGTYVAESETTPGRLIGRIDLDGSIELHEVENGNFYGTFTIRKSSTGTYGGEWIEVGKDEAYNLQLAPVAVAELPSSSYGNPQSKPESALKHDALRIPDKVTARNDKEPKKPEKSPSLPPSPPVSSALEHPRNTSRSLNPIGSRRYSAHGYVSSSDKATTSALVEPEPTLRVVENEAKPASRFSGVFKQFSAENVVTASVIIIVFIVIGVMLVISVIYSPLFRREDNPLSQQGPSNPTTNRRNHQQPNDAPNNHEERDSNQPEQDPNQQHVPLPR